MWCASTCEWVWRSAWWRGWRLPECGRVAEGWCHGGTRWAKWVGLSRPGVRGPSAVPRERCCGLWSRGSGGICPKRKRRRQLQPQQCWVLRVTLQACGDPGSCREGRQVIVSSLKFVFLATESSLSLYTIIFKGGMRRIFQLRFLNQAWMRDYNLGLTMF